MLKKYGSSTGFYSLLLAPISIKGLIFISSIYAADITPVTENKQLTDCKNYHTDFSKGTEGWVEIRGAKNNWQITKDGLELILVPPSAYTQLIDKETSDNLKYNDVEGDGPTFNATTLMHYGRFSATLKSAKTGGAVTAIILIADDKDEIDFELLGEGNKEAEDVQSNYFWGKRIVYGENGASHKVEGGLISEVFHTYTVDWNFERIQWLVDGKVVRTKTRSETKGEYPSSPARVQIGLWDGSSASGTAQWAHGPISWNQTKDAVSATIKEIKIECDPEYNNVIN
ncbi:hypothetical protein G6F16_000507 [Rhizopus arrhizus]|nr:hypothetical protein G6F23_004953 [Rhizopus arrhizus]KAG0769230.1 hypothetical protein G6F24_001258 [Rhizopus arrhizus]KAG0796011.1 hypothetical protein G6F21_001658 [Rhizopus arrhizus]KAG0799576.1 hypothetical protein G6F22_003087 [Rhizopus arrhizus]KAG0810108.1 hypothetical protein G6F20_008232 [Rhizopus arrhizus]